MKKSNKGITLVALIITIIVLLILAVVAIRAVQGDGIIKHAQSARDEYSKAQAEETVKLALNEWKIVGNVTPSAALGDFLKEKFGEDKVKDNGDETYTITTNGYDVTIDNKTLEITNSNKTGETTETGGLTILIANTEMVETSDDFNICYDHWDTMINFTKEEYEQALQAMGKGAGESLYWSDVITGDNIEGLSKRVEWTSGCSVSLNFGLVSGETLNTQLGDQQLPGNIGVEEIEDDLMYIVVVAGSNCNHDGTLYHDDLAVGLTPLYEVNSNFVPTTVTAENYEQTFANCKKVKKNDIVKTGYYCIDLCSSRYRDLSAGFLGGILGVENTHDQLGLTIPRK